MYEDTPDQSKAISDVKTDMESLSPMDRLVCGDVGFGKTEVAIRAAFKTSVDGRQAAVLVRDFVEAPATVNRNRKRVARIDADDRGGDDAAP